MPARIEGCKQIKVARLYGLNISSGVKMHRFFWKFYQKTEHNYSNVYEQVMITIKWFMTFYQKPYNKKSVTIH